MKAYSCCFLFAMLRVDGTPFGCAASSHCGSTLAGGPPGLSATPPFSSCAKQQLYPRNLLCASRRHPLVLGRPRCKPQLPLLFHHFPGSGPGSGQKGGSARGPKRGSQPQSLGRLPTVLRHSCQARTFCRLPASHIIFSFFSGFGLDRKHVIFGQDVCATHPYPPSPRCHARPLQT